MPPNLRFPGWGNFAEWGIFHEVWRHFWLSQLKGGIKEEVLLAPDGEQTSMLLNSLQCPGQAPRQRIIQKVGVPTVGQWVTQHCPSGVGCSCGSKSIPGPGNSMHHRCGGKKKYIYIYLENVNDLTAEKRCFK